MPEVSLRPARKSDFDFCAALYMAGMEWVIRELSLERAQQIPHLRKTWSVKQVQIITCNAQDAGWLQGKSQKKNFYVAQIYLAPAFQNQGIGTRAMQHVIADAQARGLGVTLKVVKSNRALNFYTRLGFLTVGEDGDKFLMRRDTLPKAEGRKTWF